MDLLGPRAFFSQIVHVLEINQSFKKYIFGDTCTMYINGIVYWYRASSPFLTAFAQFWDLVIKLTWHSMIWQFYCLVFQEMCSYKSCV